MSFSNEYLLIEKETERKGEGERKIERKKYHTMLSYAHICERQLHRETSNKKLAFTSAPRGRVLIRITRVCLSYVGNAEGSFVPYAMRALEREAAGGWKLIVKTPNMAMPNLVFLPYSSAYIRDLGRNLPGSLPLGYEKSSRGLKRRAPKHGPGHERRRRAPGVNRTK